MTQTDLRPATTPPPPADETAPELARRLRGTRRTPGDHAAGPRVRPLPPTGDGSDVRDLPTYDWDEILRHDQPDDFWIVFAGGVYDVTEWIFHHPGGAEVYIAHYGQDASEAFDRAWHSDEAWHAAQSFKVGHLAEGAAPPKQVRRPAMTTLAEEVPVVAAPRPTTSWWRSQLVPAAPGPAEQAAGEEPLEIPWAVRWLTLRGERFTNWDILNDNDTQLDYQRRFGHVYACGVPTKNWRVVVVSDPILLDEVAGDEEQFNKQTDEINFFAQLASSRGGGISVVEDSPYYERVRRIMLPWYSPSHQKTQFEKMTGVAAKAMGVLEATDDDTPVDWRTFMERYALEISGKGACNYEFGLFDAEAKTPFAAAVTDSTKESIRRIVEPRPDAALPRSSKARQRDTYRTQNELLFETVDHVVRGRMGTCPMGEQTDLLTRMVTVPDPETGTRLAPDEIRDQLLMHLSNGFNGPSITAAWMAAMLATHPDVEEKLVAEIDSVTGGDPDYVLQYTDLMALPYLTQVIKETLRIYPPMPITIRRSRKDGMLGRYRVRKGDIIFVGALAAHRDPRFWGEHPEVFDPDQFAMEKVVDRPRHAFIPFSVGTRQCMAQEVTFMMLRIAFFETYQRYRLRLAPGSTITKNTAATTKPAAVQVVRVPREGIEERQRALAERKAALKEASAAEVQHAVGSTAWDRPSEIPSTSAFPRIVVAYGSNFGSSKELAERFAERSRRYGFESEVMGLNDLAAMPERTQPWLLVVMTATYTANPPSNAMAFKVWLEQTEPGCSTWANCRYLVWGLGNAQWNAFLAFPRYVDAKLAELGAQRLQPLGYGDVGSPVWEDTHTTWNGTTWPLLIDLAGAQPSEAAAARVAAEEAAEEALTAADSTTAMALSLDGEIVAPTLMTNAVGIDTHTVRVVVCRELQAPESPTRTRHVEVSLPDGFEYTAGDHLGVCPQNDEETVERLAARLGAALDGVFQVPRSMKVRAVPKGVPLQVRNVLTCLVDVTSMPSPALLDLLLDKVSEPTERTRLTEIKEAVATLATGSSDLHVALRAGGYDTLAVLEVAASAEVNVFELLTVAQPLRPRYYSTSSSPRIHGNGTAHVSIGRNVSPVPGMPERQFRGMSSHYVHTLREGDRMNIFLDRAEGFHLQEDVTRPMIFVSAGTGYAPMRAFIWERLALKQAEQPLGRAVLFNGIRASALDYIYREEIEQALAQGVLDEAHVAMSREVPGTRDYVQDRIVGQAASVWSMLQDGAYVYICGSQTMRDQVREAFVTAVATGGGLSPEDAEAYLVAMETTEDRYRPDVWG